MLLAVIVLAACAGSPGSLRADQRVSILEPRPGSTVTEPVTIRWSSTFEPGVPSGRWFVVFLDVATIPPGQSVLTAATEPCDSVPACIEAGSLAGPNIFLTDAHGVSVGPLPGGAGPEHRLTIVLVDEQGRRDGDVAWNASFRVVPE